MKVARRVPGIFAGAEPEEGERCRAHGFRVGRGERGEDEIGIEPRRRPAERFGAFLQSRDAQKPRFNQPLGLNALERADGNDADVVSARKHGLNDVRHAVAEEAQFRKEILRIHPGIFNLAPEREPAVERCRKRCRSLESLKGLERRDVRSRSERNHGRPGRFMRIAGPAGFPRGNGVRAHGVDEPQEVGGRRNDEVGAKFPD